MSEDMDENVDNSAFNRINVSLKLNGNESGLSPMSFALTMFDSIYQLYPKVKLMVSDYEGFLNEYMGLVDGTKVDIAIGASDDSVRTCPFIVAKNAVPQQKTSSNGTGGDFETELIHDYYSVQFKKSRAYMNNISDIVRSIVREYSFTSVDVEDTLNSGYWYQPYLTDSEFMFNNLLPFAFSNSARNTPFFMFIDSNNNFNFKSFNTMFMENPIKELTYTTDNLAIAVSSETFSSINFSQVEMSKLKPLFNTEYYNYDSSGNVTSDNDVVTDYLSTSQGKYPVIGDSSNPTNLCSLYDYDFDADDTESNNDGYRINLHKDVISPDKIIINTVLDKDLVCGNTVRVNMPMVDSNATTDTSLRNSGLYLIESSYHIWDGHNARTMLICSKQKVSVTSEYRNKGLLFS